MKNVVVKEVELNEADMDRLEKAFYEYDMFKDNMAFVIAQNAKDPNFFKSALYENMHDKEMEVYKNYIDTKDYITINCLPEDVKVDGYTWEADFVNRKLIIKE